MNEIKIMLRNAIIAQYGSIGNFSIQSSAGVLALTVSNFLNLQDTASINISSLLPIMEKLNFVFSSNSDKLNQLLEKFGNISLGLNLKDIRGSQTRQQLANVAKTTTAQICNIENALRDFRFKTIYNIYLAMGVQLTVKQKTS
jgi:DNA-binding phage protein